MGQLIAIAAIAENGVIGNRGKLPWHIPQDLKRFKTLTTGHIVLMGRKTFESLGNKPLPGRLNIVVTRQKQSCATSNLSFVSDIDQTIDFLTSDPRNVYIIGGTSIYEQTINKVERLELTRVEGEFEGDSYFPEFDYADFCILEQQRLTPNSWTETYIRAY